MTYNKNRLVVNVFPCVEQFIQQKTVIAYEHPIQHQLRNIYCDYDRTMNDMVLRCLSQSDTN